MPLTDVQIRQAKPRERPYKLSDSGGLYVQIAPAGGKLWRLKYRFLTKEKVLSLGPYPIVSLADAREGRDKAKKLLIAGIDPSEAKRQGKEEALEAAAQTFGSIAEEFLKRLESEGRAKSTVVKSRWLLLDLAVALKERPIRQITPSEALTILRKIEAKGNRESAIRCRSAMSRVFRYAITTSRATEDPTAALAGALLAPQVKHHSAITAPKAVGAMMVAIDALEGSEVVKAALKLLALCFPRPGELRYAEWADIALDKAVWYIPAHRAKMRRTHEIPLSTQALTVFKELQDISGNRKLVFPGIRNAARPLSENTLNVALRRLGYTADEMTSHGFRSTASTLLNESGLWNPDAIERALAHRDSNSVRKAYARSEYWEERVRMAQWWADHLDLLRTGSEPSL